jgi:hypothetical protein
MSNFLDNFYVSSESLAHKKKRNRFLKHLISTGNLLLHYLQVTDSHFHATLVDITFQTLHLFCSELHLVRVQ